MGKVNRRGCAVGVVLVALLMSAASARAEDPQRAKELFQQGTTFFDLGQFDKAIDAWQEGYKQKPDPGFLYNIAQAYRLAGDAQKAIFFYRGYLRNSPKAHNRAEVEQKIAALQKQVGDAALQKQGPGQGQAQGQGPGNDGKTPPPLPPLGAAPVAPPPPAPAPPAVASAAPAPPTGAAPTSPAATAPPPVPEPAIEPAPAQAEPTVVAAPPPVVPSELRAADLSVGVGSEFWASGVAGSVQPSFAFLLTAGYAFGGADARARFRLGAVFGYTPLSEATTKDSFTSVLLDPSLRVQLTADRRLFFGADLGAGVLVVGGLKPGSSLLERTQTLMVSGAQSLFELRPAASLEYLLRPSVALFLGPALEYSPKKLHFYSAITRMDLLAGVSFKL